MLKAISRLFDRQIEVLAAAGDDADRERAYRLAAAALLIEMTRADNEVVAAERTAVAQAVQRAFDLSAQEAAELLPLAEQKADAATSLFEFTRLINEHFDPAQKERLIELMWCVAYADGELDKYEEHLVRKVADLIYVPHVGFIRAKHRAKEAATRDG